MERTPPMSDAFQPLLERAEAAWAAWQTPERPRINVAIETSSLAGGAGETLQALERRIEARGAAVDVGRTHGYGMQWLQPLADITWPDGTRVLYGPVTPDRVGQLIDEATGRTGAADTLAIGTL